MKPSDRDPEYLRALGTVKTVIDIGVADGTLALYAAFPDAHLVLIDPTPGYRDSIDAISRQYKSKYLPFAVGDRDADNQIMYVEPVIRRKSSLRTRTPLTKTGDAVIETPVPMRTLDTLLHGDDFVVAPICIKIDVEGYEAAVIEGARQTLQRTQFVIVEVSVAARFHGSPTFAEFIALMSHMGFALFDIIRIRKLDRRSGRA